MTGASRGRIRRRGIQVPLLMISGIFSSLSYVSQTAAQNRVDPSLFQVPSIQSSWDDLLVGIESEEDWKSRRETLKSRYLQLIRDQAKPQRPPLELQVHERVEVDGIYVRSRISYQVEEGERAEAFLAMPIGEHPAKSLAGVVVLHGTFPQGIEQAAGLVDDRSKAHLDDLARRGLVVLAPEHFVSGKRTPPEGPYDTTRFHAKHPEWTAVGKFTFEHSIAIDVLQSLPEVDPERMGAMGHSLGGHGAMFLAAYDDRVKAAAGNAAAAFFRHNPDVLEWSRDRWYVYFKPLREDLMKGEMPPIDFHEIMALVAPRAYLDISGLNDGHRATQKQRVLMLVTVSEIWQRLGAEERFAFWVHGKGHAVPPEARELMGNWLTEQLAAPR